MDSRRCFAAALAGLLSLGGCVVAPAPYAPPYGETVVVAPSPGYIWIDGYWGWTGQQRIWVPGRWEPPGRGWGHRR